MWHGSSPGSFSHKFLPNRHSGFPRQANAITALQTASHYPEQSCFPAWGSLGNIHKAGQCKIPKTSGPLMLRNWPAFHGAMVLTAGLVRGRSAGCGSSVQPSWMESASLLHEHVFAAGAKLLSLQTKCQTPQRQGVSSSAPGTRVRSKSRAPVCF